MSKSWLRLMTIFESRDIVWDPAIAYQLSDHPIHIQRSIIRASLRNDQDRVPPLFAIVLRSLDDGDFEMTGMAITFLRMLLDDFTPFAQAEFEQLFRGICQVARDIRISETAPQFGETVLQHFGDAWDSFLTNLPSLAAQVSPTCTRSDEIAQLCKDIRTVRDLLDRNPS
jgi:hypothetical protein